MAAAFAVTFLLASAPASAETGFAIDPEGSCSTSSCHEKITKKETVHVPSAAGDECVVCHDMEDERRHRFELAEKGGALCFTCHDEDEFSGKTVHGPVGEGRCTACHNPHASDVANLLRTEPPDLCFGCHNKTLKDAKGKKLPPPKRTFQDKAMKLHPPFEAGECIGCHLPHASANYRLLVEPYPASTYAKFSADRYVCFMCHDDEAFSEPRTLEATGFRNGNLNLHYRHVNRKKGRVCKVCHDHHGAANDKLIRRQVPFGSRSITIRKFETTETGGSCAPTCHIEVSYDRYDPAINGLKVTPRKGADATPAELQRAKKEQLGE